jgi:hypothetical protein
VAAEVKLSDHNTLSHSLWDIVKLLGVLALFGNHVYLIAGYPARIWQKDEFATLYAAGIVPYTQLPIAKEWRRCSHTARVSRSGSRTRSK